MSDAVSFFFWFFFFTLLFSVPIWFWRRRLDEDTIIIEEGRAVAILPNGSYQTISTPMYIDPATGQQYVVQQSQYPSPTTFYQAAPQPTGTQPTAATQPTKASQPESSTALWMKCAIVVSYNWQPQVQQILDGIHSFPTGFVQPWPIWFPQKNTLLCLLGYRNFEDHAVRNMISQNMQDLWAPSGPFCTKTPKNYPEGLERLYV